MHAIDLTGQTFSRWTVISRAPNIPQGQAQWFCRCICGTERTLKSIVLRRGISRSCGCLNVETVIKRSTKHGHSSSTKITPTYHSWAGMLARCTNPNNSSYPRYGGVGITVCDRWRTFANFLADMGDKPDGFSIGRIDGSKGYEPSNCRWETSHQQARNRSNNRILTFQGESLSIAEWAERLGIKASAISERLADGWSVQDALTKPAIGNRRFFTLNGETKSMRAWAISAGISPITLWRRIKSGLSLEEALLL